MTHANFSISLVINIVFLKMIFSMITSLIITWLDLEAVLEESSISKPCKQELKSFWTLWVLFTALTDALKFFRISHLVIEHSI